MPDNRQERRLEKLKARFAAAGIWPRVRLGQNFLLDKNQVNYIARLGEVGPADVILEVGPGTGFLSGELLRQGAAVLGVEIDRRLIEIVREETAAFPGMILMLADILASKSVINPEVMARLRELLDERGPQARLKSISNLPYSAGTPFVANLFSSDLPWVRGVFLLQLEVAERLAARPGNPAYSSLSVVAGLGGTVRIARKIPPQVFWPRPKVAGAAVVVEYKPLAARQAVPWKALRRVTTAAFSSRRKTLRNAFKGLFVKGKADAVIQELGLDSQSRVCTLAPEQFLSLARYLEAREASPE